MVSSQLMLLSGPGNYTFAIPSSMLDLGGTLMTLTTTDADGNQQSSNVLVYVGGCNNADFYHYQTDASLTV
jgi:hypothetical protein